MPIACAGHWVATLLYLVPVVAVLGLLKLSTWRETSRERRAQAGVSDART
jgi:hypothetical protein